MKPSDVAFAISEWIDLEQFLCERRDFLIKMKCDIETALIDIEKEREFVNRMLKGAAKVIDDASTS